LRRSHSFWLCLQVPFSWLRSCNGSRGVAEK
jgi:hypothetical protein